MYQTSDNYKLKIYEASTRHVLRVYINDIEIDTKYILDCRSSQQLFNNNEFALGSVTAQAVELKVYKSVVPDEINTVYIESGIKDEIIPIGYFNVDGTSKEDDYTVTLKLIDNMVKFDFNYDGSELTYPCSIINVLNDICSKSGVELRFYFFFESKQTDSGI